MKTGIHPPYYQTKVVCSCGATYEIGGTAESLKVDICRECHPFYTGNQKLIDTAGRIDRFREKVERAKIIKARQKGKKAKPAEESDTEDQAEKADGKDKESA